jgi:hypothetical protein
MDDIPCLRKNGHLCEGLYCDDQGNYHPEWIGDPKAPIKGYGYMSIRPYDLEHRKEGWCWKGTKEAPDFVY